MHADTSVIENKPMNNNILKFFPNEFHYGGLSFPQKEQAVKTYHPCECILKLHFESAFWHSSNRFYNNCLDDFIVEPPPAQFAFRSKEFSVFDPPPNHDPPPEEVIEGRPQ